MAFSAWSGRLAVIGATPTEISAISASYYAASTSVQGALDTLIAGIANADLAVMLNTWRTAGAPFQDGFPGGGLPFGTGVAVLTGSAADDASAISAGTGRKISLTGATITIGPPGVGANWRGVWSSASTYAVGDGVAGSSGTLYISNVAANLNHDPTTDVSSRWSQIFGNVASLAASNTFTAGQVVMTDSVGVTFQNAAGDQLLQFQNIAGPGHAAGAVIFSSDNGLGSNGRDVGMGVDTVAHIPYRDLVVGYKIGAGDTAIDSDGIYDSHRGLNPSSWSFGEAQPGDHTIGHTTGYRLKVQPGDIYQGGVQIIGLSGQIGYALSVADGPGNERFLIDPATWGTILRGDSTTSSPRALSVQDFHPTATGGGGGSATVSAGTAGVNAVQTVSFGGATSGAAAITLPSQLGAGVSTAVAYNATALAVQLAITETLLCPANAVTVTGSAGGPYTVTFTQQAPVSNLAVGTGLSGGSGASVTSATTGVLPVYPELLGIEANGKVVWGGDSNAALYRSATGIMAFVNHVQFGGILSAVGDQTAGLDSVTTGVLRVRNSLKILGEVGFNNTDPVAKPTVTGSRGGNAALASLLTGLAGTGILTDSSTA